MIALYMGGSTNQSTTKKFTIMVTQRRGDAHCHQKHHWATKKTLPNKPNQGGKRWEKSRFINSKLGERRDEHLVDNLVHDKVGDEHYDHKCIIMGEDHSLYFFFQEGD